MKDYGKLFKKFRESRGLVLKDIAKLGVSVSHISRFERENTDLTISKFMSALNAINMPIDEFMYAAIGIFIAFKADINLLIVSFKCDKYAY